MAILKAVDGSLVVGAMILSNISVTTYDGVIWTDTDGKGYTANAVKDYPVGAIFTPSAYGVYNGRVWFKVADGEYLPYYDLIFETTIDGQTGTLSVNGDTADIHFPSPVIGFLKEAAKFGAMGPVAYLLSKTSTGKDVIDTLHSEVSTTVDKVSGAVGDYVSTIKWVIGGIVVTVVGIELLTLLKRP